MKNQIYIYIRYKSRISEINALESDIISTKTDTSYWQKKDILQYPHGVLCQYLILAMRNMVKLDCKGLENII